MNLESLQGLPVLFDAMVDAAPGKELKSATEDAQSILRQRQTPHSLSRLLDSSQPFMRVDNYLEQNCPAHSALALETLLINYETRHTRVR